MPARTRARSWRATGSGHAGSWPTGAIPWRYWSAWPRTEGDRRLGPGLSADDYDFGEVVEIVNAARDLQAKIAECERDLRDMGTTNT